MGEAIVFCDNRAVQILLEHGCNPNALVTYDRFKGQTSKHTILQRLSPLLMAIELDNLSVMHLLIEGGASADHRSRFGLIRSPLQRAAELGDSEAVSYLLERGAPVDSEPFYSGGTPLQLAALSGHVGIAALPIDKGANVNFEPARGDGRAAFEAA